MAVKLGNRKRDVVPFVGELRPGIVLCDSRYDVVVPHVPAEEKENENSRRHENFSHDADDPVNSFRRKVSGRSHDRAAAVAEGSGESLDGPHREAWGFAHPAGDCLP